MRALSTRRRSSCRASSRTAFPSGKPRRRDGRRSRRPSISAHRGCAHPAGTEKSVLTWLIGDAQTIPADRGLFLEHTFRHHPEICSYISDEFYEGRLLPDARTAKRTTPLGTGLRYVEVAHEGNRQESSEEVEAVRDVIDRLLAAGVAVREVMVVSPYNAQVNAWRVLPAAVSVGTVDKFQGQEADVVIYSMASSSGQDVPHGLEFLLLRNRLNVAISRARCLAYLVASPRLLEVNCKTIEQMRLANALCRFVELAQESAPLIVSQQMRADP